MTALKVRLWQFRYDDRNPYRRRCVECGQRQDVTAIVYRDGRGPSWWADTLPVPDPACMCHEFAAVDDNGTPHRLTRRRFFTRFVPRTLAGFAVAYFVFRFALWFVVNTVHGWPGW